MREICIDCRMAFHSGIGTYIRNILPYLKEAFPRLYVLAPLSLIDKWPELQTYDLLPFEAPLYSIQEQIQFPFRIPSCDLYWTPHYNVPVLPIRAKRRVVTIHDVYHLAYGYTLSALKRAYAKIMIKRAADVSDHIITGSQFSFDEICRYTKTPCSKLSMIHDGVNLNLFSYPAEQSTLESVKKRYHLPENYFLFVSTLAPHKNVTGLLKAWSLIIQRFPQWELVLVGKQVANTDYLKVLEEMPTLKPKVHFVGRVEEHELTAIYQLAYGSIAPSFYEGFGLTPLESMAMRCPAIVSNRASLPEVCGDAALYVNPLDIENIAQVISSLIESASLRDSLIQKGIERATYFKWEKTAQQHIELMEKLA